MKSCSLPHLRTTKQTVPFSGPVNSNNQLQTQKMQIKTAVFAAILGLAINVQADNYCKIAPGESYVNCRKSPNTGSAIVRKVYPADRFGASCTREAQDVFGDKYVEQPTVQGVSLTRAGPGITFLDGAAGSLHTIPGLQHLVFPAASVRLKYLTSSWTQANFPSANLSRCPSSARFAALL